MRAARFTLMTVTVLVLLVTLAGCGSSSNKSSDTSSTATSATAPSGADGNSAARGAGPGQPCRTASEPPVPGKPIVPMPATAPAKLTIKDLKVGTGPVVKPGATVVANYVGVSCSTGTEFDSSWKHGGPQSFSLNGVIPGWTQGIPGMRVGGRRLLVVPPDLGYADNPGPGIKPGETLVFVVDMVSTT